MSGGHSSTGLGDAIKKGVGLVHGTGEAIRGNFNAGVDQAAGDRAGVNKNTAIASKGASEIEHGYHRTGHGAGVTPADVDRERLNTTHNTSTNYGSHSTNTGNKLDPRFDSDMDHRGTATGSTNAGPHSNNVANKLDPRFDSDLDHRANPNSCCAPTLYSQTDGTDSTTEPFGGKWEPQAGSGHDHAHDHDEHCNCHAQHIHRGSISGGTNLKPAEKLDPVLDVEDASTKCCINSVDAANKLDLRVESDHNRRSHDIDAQTGRVGTFARRGTEPLVRTSHVAEAEAPLSHGSGSDDELDRHARRESLSQQSHSSTAPSDEPRSTADAHKSDFLSLLDPGVDRRDAKQMQSSGS
ncbi:uncharacterized protein EKO05_0005153 [Ascochyta rabiei]|uniref:Uncharacterized protein n=1 Tax=Didymella rabiei TaxID=5454 RepID=A0A162V7C9_DIDRA|nr:uncharacterized protein EKO05_0005153 [Ascochyta rabiei]KZM18268.1 hypothetical protein ST47_g10583 [Ascochyta rabiei]UPX14678.1 hypothetical protein EKO05_0005153 [Ascochyta rabiei]